jgi:hypothetical protein
MRALLLILIAAISFSSCKSGKSVEDDLYAGQIRVTGNFKDFTSHKKLAILPAQIRFNSRHPKTRRTDKRTKLAHENERDWMYHDYIVLSAQPERLMIHLQPPDSTIFFLEKAKITTKDLPYIDRQKLLTVLNVDALLEHQIEVNVYASTTEDVITHTAMVILLAGAASMGGIPHGNFSKSQSSNSIEFMKVYGRGAERPLWSYYGNSDYSGRKVPKIRKKSIDRFRILGFPFLR